MDKKLKNIYDVIDNNTRQWTIKVKNTLWRNKESTNSYSFDIKGLNNNDKLEQISDYLKKIFNISTSKEIEAFDRAITQVCSGYGNEAEKITVLRSSSLCCLLFFYNISINPISIDCGNKKVIFNKAFFEVKNDVIKKPSNVDVVLISNDLKTILFLESKFAEYYLDNGAIKVSKSYLEHEISKVFYSSEVMKKFGFTIKTDDTEEFTVDSDNNILKKNKSYVEGIKQMVSHYIGINNFLGKTEKTIESKNDKITLSDDVNIYLGEVLFDFPQNTEMSAYLEDYKEKYKILTENLKQNKNITLLSNILLYSSFKDNLSNAISQFYYGIKT